MYDFIELDESEEIMLVPEAGILSCFLLSVVLLPFAAFSLSCVYIVLLCAVALC